MCWERQRAKYNSRKRHRRGVEDRFRWSSESEKVKQTGPIYGLHKHTATEKDKKYFAIKYSQQSCRSLTDRLTLSHTLLSSLTFGGPIPVGHSYVSALCNVRKKMIITVLFTSLSKHLRPTRSHKSLQQLFASSTNCKNSIFDVYVCHLRLFLQADQRAE